MQDENQKFRFESLNVYEKTIEFNILVNELVNTYKENDFLVLGKTFIETSQSMALNIAIGSGKNRNDFIEDLKKVKTSIRQSIVLIEFSKRFGYIDEEKELVFRNKLTEISKMISGFINSLKPNSKPAKFDRKTQKDNYENSDLHFTDSDDFNYK